MAHVKLFFTIVYTKMTHFGSNVESLPFGAYILEPVLEVAALYYSSHKNDTC